MSADKSRIAARLRDERKKRRLTVQALAEAFRDHASERDRRRLPKLEDLRRMIRGYEAGEHVPRERNRMLYAAVFGMAECDLFDMVEEEPSDTGDAIAGSLVGATVPTHAKDDDVERRQALMLMGLGVAAPWPVAENLRAALAHVAGASGSVADWQETVSEYARTMSATPPAQILPDLLSDLNEINALLEAGHPEQQKMLEVAAALAAFSSMAIYDSGQPGRSFRWWRPAQQLADKSGYAPIRAYVRARRGADLFYGRKQTTQALQLADEAVRIAAVPDQARASAGVRELRALTVGKALP